MKEILRPSTVLWHAVPTVLESLGFGAWALDVADGSVRWSTNLGPMFGREPGFQPSDFDDALSLIHPDDRLEVAKVKLPDRARGMEFRVVWPDGSLHWLSGRWQSVPEESDGPAALGLIIDATDHHRRSTEDRYLVEASRVLNDSGDIDEALQRVTDILVPQVADWAGISLVRGSTIQPVAVSHADPERLDWARQLVGSGPAVDSEELVALTVRSGQPTLVRDIGPSAVARITQDPERAKIVERLGLTSLIIAPLSARSQVLGALTLVSAESRIRFDEQDLKFARDLADRVAIAIENARLQSSLSDTAARLRRINAITAGLSSASTMQAVADVAVTETMAAVRAARGTVVLRDQTGGELRLVAAPGYSPQRAAGWTESFNQTGTPIAEAFRTRRPVYVESRDELLARYPALAHLSEPPMGEAWVAVPMARGRDVHGVLGLSFDRRVAFTDDMRSFLHAVGQQCGLALERSRLFEQKASIADSLQQGLVPAELPRIDGVESAFRYQPGGIGEVGGDWFDVLQTQSGAVVAMVGDVVGRGIPAVATMAQFRNGLRTLLLQDETPGAALAVMNKVSFHAVPDERRFTTVSCLRYDATSGKLVIGNAGHLPPVLRTPESTTLLQVPSNPPLGVEREHAFDEYVVAPEGPFILVLYTDGTVERRRGDLMDQCEALSRTAAQAPFHPKAILDDLVERFAVGDTGDDATLLALRFDGQAG